MSEYGFNFRPFYDEIIHGHKDYYAIAQIGAGTGESLVYLIQGLQRRNAHQPGVHDYFAVYAIDSFEKGCEEYQRTVVGKTRDFVIDIRKPSDKAVGLFSDRYFDLVLLNQNFSYSSLREDIERWFPKIRPNKMISGQGYDKIEVQQAVNEAVQGKLGLTVNTVGTVWYAIRGEQ